VKKFKVVFEVVTFVDVDEEVLADAMSEDFRKSFYNLPDEKAVASHLAYNFVANRADLPQLDGFAHWSKDKAKLDEEDWDPIEVEEVLKHRKRRSNA